MNYLSRKRDVPTLLVVPGEREASWLASSLSGWPHRDFPMRQPYRPSVFRVPWPVIPSLRSMATIVVEGVRNLLTRLCRRSFLFLLVWPDSMPDPTVPRFPCPG